MFSNSPLSRFSTQFCADEDRLFLTCENDAGETHIIWLTQRLTNKLLVVLFGFADKISVGRTLPAESYDLWRSGLQQTASAALETTRAPEPNSITGRYLATSVSVTPQEDSLQLVFLAEGASSIPLKLSVTQMLQWLKALYICYVNANWSFQDWPQWFLEASASDVPRQADKIWH